MPAEDRAPRDGVAGVRLASGRLAFVRGAPGELRAGTPVRIRLADGEQAGTVHIPPALLFWCDPALPLGDFLGVDTTAPALAATEADSRPADVAWVLAPEDAPDAATRAAMVELARSDLARLDDVPSSAVRSRPADGG